MINKVILIGNLGRDPEVRHLESGAAVAKFSVATNENYKDRNGDWQTQTEWHDVVAWRSLAERAERDLKKGKLVFVEGKLTHRKYQDKDGNDRYITEVRALSIRLLEKREGTGNNFNSNFPSEEPTMTNTSSAAPAATPMTNTSNTAAADDDLPF
ncbi:MAG: single-stranded DNA-binding protein [Bacteroidota bacterium]